MVGSSNYTAANTGANAVLNDLHAAAFTIDGWFRVKPTGASQYFFIKGTGSIGWYFVAHSTNLLQGKVCCATTDAVSTSNVEITDNLWHYLKMTFDYAGDKKIRLYLDGAGELSYSSRITGEGAIDSDAAEVGRVGNFPGMHGWIRISNIVRGGGLIPRFTPPIVDANTIAQWNVDEGMGTVLSDETINDCHLHITGVHNWSRY
jgi:hypothetical protein